jgi:hypothetical protein
LLKIAVLHKLLLKWQPPPGMSTSHGDLTDPTEMVVIPRAAPVHTPGRICRQPLLRYCLDRSTWH